MQSLNRTQAQPARLEKALRPIALSLRLCFAGLPAALLMVAPAMAQNTPAAHAQLDFAIPAGPLNAALQRFIADSGVLVSADGSLTEGKTSPGVHGQYTPAQALGVLLEGTGLEAAASRPGNFVLRPRATQSQGEIRTLGETHVTARAPEDFSTEGSASYAASGATLFKRGTTLREIPQSISVLTRQSLEDQQLSTLTDVLGKATGVVVDYTDSERVTYYARGYQIDAVQLDGITLVQGSGGGSYIQTDTAILDRVEVLRGASGMLRGAGNPAGTVNMVRKRPTREFQASANVQAGSWDSYRVEGDVSGGIAFDGALRARAVVVHEDKRFFQQVRQERRDVFYGVLETDLGERTTLSAGVEYSDLDATGAWGNLPADYRDGSPLDLPRDFYLGADWNRWNRWNLHVFGTLEHRLDNDWVFKLSASNSHFQLKEFKQTYFVRATSQTNPYLWNVQTSTCEGGKSDQYGINATASGPFNLFGRRHELMVGAERTRDEATASGCTYDTYLTAYDIRNWDPRHSLAEPDQTVTAATVLTRTTQKGVYGNLKLSLADPLTALVGARLSWWEYERPATPASNYDVNREVTPYGALIYDLNEQLSAYGSYTEIFTPQNATDINGKLLEPIRGESYELGLKGEFYGGRLNTSLALFRTEQVGKALDDTSRPDLCLPTNTSGSCKVAGGKNRSQGYELEVAGEVAPGWQLSAGYTFNITKYLKDTVSVSGTPLRTTDPRHLLKLFTSYRLPGEFSAWTVGGGVNAQSRTYARSGTLEAEQDAYAVVNAMVSYRIDKKHTLQLNITNLFDQEYYKKIGATGVNYYQGEPRSAMLVFRAKY